MLDRNFTLNISDCDAILSDGEIHFVKKGTDDFITLMAKGIDAAPKSFTHGELAKLIDEGRFAVEYGYFSDRNAARRARAGRSVLSRLSHDVQMHAFVCEAWCEAMVEAERDGAFNRSSQRWQEYFPQLQERVRDKLETGLLKASDGRFIDPKLLTWEPCRTTAMAMLRKWTQTKDPMVFVKRSIFNGPNANRVHVEVEAIVQVELKNYLHPNEIFPAQVLQAVNAEVRRKNTARRLSGEELLPEVSQSTIERRINALDRFEVLAARKGLAVAKNKLGAHGGGLKVQAPLFRIEMDEWEIDLIAALKKAGIDISQTSLRDLELGRYWVCVAFDTASRSILGLKLSTKPNADDAKAVLWMAMRDKTALASQLGCETAWKQHGHIYHVAVDNGPAFVNADFKAALSDLGIDYSVLPAGIPQLRGHVERIFRSIITLLMPYLTGRTFSNPQERGDYPSQKYAVHTAESIVELLVRFTVDVYHNREHKSLEYSTPNLTWDSLVSEFGWSPPMSQHKLRHILGIKLSRAAERHGVLVNGVNYHSDRLAKHIQKFGPQTVEVSIDPENMGHVSVWLENNDESGWSTLKAQMDGLDDVSFASWERMIFELRQNNRDAARLSQGVIDRAIARIKKIDAEQCAMRQLGPIKLTQDVIKRAQRETFWGLSLGGTVQKQQDVEEDGEATEFGLLSDEIPYLPGPQPEERSVFIDLDEDDGDEWVFSDELGENNDDIFSEGADDD